MLISTYNEIEKRTVYDCRVKSIMELMRHYGLILTAQEILLISRAITFQYDKISVPGLIQEPIPYGTVSNDNIEKAFFENLGIPYIEEKIGSSKEEWNYMKGLLDKGTPIMFKIDSRFLSEGYQAHGKLNLYYLSTLLLVGYEEESGSVWIVLTNTDEKDRVTRLSLQEFQEYRNTVCMPFSADYRCYYLDENNGIKDITAKRVKQAVLSGLRDFTATMLDTRRTDGLLYGAFVGSSRTSGINGMISLKGDLQDILSQCKEADAAHLKYIKFKLIFVRNNLLFGSRTAFRSELAKCLEMCSNKLKISEISDISQNFYTVSGLWIELFTKLSRVTHEEGDITENLEDIIMTLDSIIQSEKTQYKSLYQKLLK